MRCFCIGIFEESRRRVRYPYQNNECVLHRQFEHEFVVVFVTYYAFHVDVMDVL